MTRFDPAHCAAKLAEARLTSSPVPAFDSAAEPATIDQGYDVQAALHTELCRHSGAILAGWKVGATSSGMQQYLGVDGPAYGRILDSNVIGNGATLRRDAYCNPGIECEIAVRIGTDTDGDGYDRDTIRRAIGAVMPAIEIVENRYGDFLERGTPNLIADDFFHKACVLGDAVEGWETLDLSAIAGRTLIDGRLEGEGIGADVLGHPLEAVAWLANILSSHGRTLSAGEVVLTGSVAPVIWLTADVTDARIELDPLGTVSVSFD